jgi:hypothetical protein
LRRLLHLIALAILTLSGPVGLVRTLAGPVGVACQCGCCGASGKACDCGKDVPPPPHAPTRVPCPMPSAPCGLQAALTSPVGLVEENMDGRVGPDAERRPEPKPWPGSLARLGPELAAPPVPVRFRGATAFEGLRSLDRLARLAVFRI